MKRFKAIALCLCIVMSTASMVACTNDDDMDTSSGNPSSVGDMSDIEDSSDN